MRTQTQPSTNRKPKRNKHLSIQSNIRAGGRGSRRRRP